MNIICRSETEHLRQARAVGLDTRTALLFLPLFRLGTHVGSLPRPNMAPRLQDFECTVSARTLKEKRVSSLRELTR